MSGGQLVVPKLVTKIGLTLRRSDQLEDVDSWPIDIDDLVEVAAYRPRGDGT
ncbi:hypothetical protein [Streptomyces zhihengii]|uniref:Uncharacterized protein n=1 Tax=Streptomyces zhihengii TaxID=1818004 RepID=A0ABS2V728_9ACTN|nr:hypothetical protein [Streptomyces zhihengii]MBM9624762.1 hypothetical protein [Streptomyces zhihengii]